MAFWECKKDIVSREHVHEFDEYFIVIEGRYTLIIGGFNSRPSGPGVPHPQECSPRGGVCRRDPDDSRLRWQAGRAENQGLKEIGRPRACRFALLCFYSLFIIRSHSHENPFDRQEAPGRLRGGA